MKRFKLLVATVLVILGWTVSTEAAVTKMNTSTSDFNALVQRSFNYKSWWEAGCNDAAINPWQHTDSGDTLEEVIDAMTELPYEMATVFDQQGRKIVEGTNRMRDVVAVWLPSEGDPTEWDMYHWHPLEDGGFSASDLGSAAGVGYHSISAVAWDYIFTMSPNPEKNKSQITVNGGWPIPEELQEYHQQQLDAAEKMKRFSFSADQADILALLEYKGNKWWDPKTMRLGTKFLITHYAALKTAEHFGLDYTVTLRRPEMELKGTEGRDVVKISYDNPLTFKPTKAKKHPTKYVLYTE